MTEKRLERKDLEDILELLEISVRCYINHCDSCVAYDREYMVKQEFWRLENILREMIKDDDDREA